MADKGSNPPREHVIARLRPHARALFWPVILLLAICAAVGYFGNQFAVWENLLIIAAGGLAAVLFFLLPLVNWLSKRYTITNRRVIVRRGLFVRQRSQVLHSRGYDVTVRRTMLQAAFRTGTLLIETGSDRRLVLRDVPRATLVQSALNDLVEDNHIVLPFQARNQLLGQTAPWGQR